MSLPAIPPDFLIPHYTPSDTDTKIVGTGKTKLTSLVVEELQRDLDMETDAESLAYFYMDRTQPFTPLAILRSFVRQLATIHDRDRVQPALEDVHFHRHKRYKWGDGHPELTRRECETLLSQLTNIYRHTVLVIDAVDECDSDVREVLAKVVGKVLHQPANPVKIFISSGEDERIQSYFNKGSDAVPTLNIATTDNDADIAKFVQKGADGLEEQWEQRGKVPMPSDLRRVICETLATQSEGS